MTMITGVTTATITPISSTTFDISYSTGSAPPSPTFTPSSSPTTSGAAVTIGTVAPGTSGDTLTVSLTSDAKFTAGSTIALSGANVVYTPGTITSGNAGSDSLVFLVSESNGASASFSGTVTLTFSSGGTGNGLVMANVNRATQLSHFNTALAAVKAGTAGARCIVACTGDSTTMGVTSVSQAPVGTPYPDQLAIALGTIESVPYNYSHFYGNQNSMPYLAFTGTTYWNWGLSGPGSGSIIFHAASDTATWSGDARLTGTFDHIDVTYYDASGAQTWNVIIGANTYTLTIAGTSNTMVTTSIPITAVTNPSSIQFKFMTGTYGYLMGCALWSYATPSIEVRDVGVGGSLMSQMNGSLSGVNQISGIVSLAPHLVIINFGINDVNSSGNSGAETLAQLQTYLTTGVSILKTSSDVLIVCPQPFVATTSPAPAFTQAQVVTAQLGVATTKSLPIGDLCATYGNNGAAFQATSLSSGNGPHPSAAGYADIAKRIASFLSNTAQTYASVGLPAPITGSGWSLD